MKITVHLGEKCKSKPHRDIISPLLVLRLLKKKSVAGGCGERGTSVH